METWNRRTVRWCSRSLQKQPNHHHRPRRIHTAIHLTFYCQTDDRTVQTQCLHLGSAPTPRLAQTEAQLLASIYTRRLLQRICQLVHILLQYLASQY